MKTKTGSEKKGFFKKPDKKGFASIEATVLLVLFFVMLYYSFGFFGIVHTGLIHNIHSRTYAFEIFRHRANLMHFRSNDQGPSGPKFHYYNLMVRLHGINTDSQDNAVQQIATERPISFGLVLDESGRDPSTHSDDVYGINSERNRSVGVNPVWITTLYGLCLNSRCER